MSFADLVNADIRLVILRALAEDQGYSHNEAVLREVLAAVGHRVSRDAVRTHLAWLAEQGLLIVESAGGIQVATIRQRGIDVAQGSACCPGVKRPLPEL